MAYFADLTPYEYVFRYPYKLPVLNVGWLCGSHPYPQGDVPPEFTEVLFRWCHDDYVGLLALGIHICELCHPQPDEQQSQDWYQQGVRRYGEHTSSMGTGCGEIRVFGQDAVYAAPALIYHYVTEHHYRPPQPFIDAVISGPHPWTEAYAGRMQVTPMW